MPIRPPSFRGRQLLGKSPDSNALREWLSIVIPSHHQPIPDPEIKRFPDCTYYAFKSLGLSFCFVPTSDNILKLDSIDIYNGHTRDGFHPFVGTEYPFGLASETEAHEIVNQLGEPDRKGGGGRTRTPCWIEYKFENDSGGLMIQLHGVDWDDREMGWTSLTLY
ncbi:hypothetical protein BX666DRAFT_2028996 [Dichotomocladium elegans]|nr:hypothetical protein BX666DRAFT_2028996 [Dichotomocladium elegans]